MSNFTRGREIGAGRALRAPRRCPQSGTGHHIRADTGLQRGITAPGKARFLETGWTQIQCNMCCSNTAFGWRGGSSANPNSLWSAAITVVISKTLLSRNCFSQYHRLKTSQRNWFAHLLWKEWQVYVVCFLCCFITGKRRQSLWSTSEITERQ